MAFNLFALCKFDNQYKTFRISLNRDLQEKVGLIFENQKNDFINEIEEIIEFNGDWKPDKDELFTIPIPNDAQIIVSTIALNPISIDDLDINNLNQMTIKALFGQNEQGEILIQYFSKTQFLNHSFSLFLTNNTYNQLVTPTITLNNKILCYISENTLKFKSFNNLRYLFDLSDLYTEATDEDIVNFSELESIEVNNLQMFKNNASQNIRKRIHNILSYDRFSQYTGSQIFDIARVQGFDNIITINPRNNKIILPENKQELNRLLSFLDEKLFKGYFSNSIILANSTRVENT